MAVSAMRDPGQLTALDRAVLELEQTLAANAADEMAYVRLITILSEQIPSPVVAGRYTSAQRRLARDYVAEDCFRAMIDPAETARLMTEWRAILAEAGVANPLGMRQIFGGDSVRLGGEAGNCMQRLALFFAEGVISKLCYGCFKVQILPADVVSLVQTFSVLRGLELPRDNNRKCMVDIREEIANPYKGYVYCESEDEAEQCREIVLRALETAGVTNVAVGLSHGCSEYGLKYPGYKYAADGGHRAFPRPAIWERIEALHFAKRPLQPAPPRTTSAAHVSLRDVFALETWSYFAEIIGDETHAMLPKADPTQFSERFKARLALQAEQKREELEALRARIASRA